MEDQRTGRLFRRPEGLALLVLVAALTAACLGAGPPELPALASAAPSPSSSGNAAPRPSASRLGSPVASTRPPPAIPSAQPVLLRPDTFASVVTDDLRVRTEPFVGETSRKLEPLLWNGVDLFVIAGPVAGSGYDWYLVEPMGEVDLQINPDPPPPGWVAAASHDGEPWLAPSGVECFETPLGWLAFELVDRPNGLTGLSCFGDRKLHFTAGLSVESAERCTYTTGPWSIEPAWLASCQKPSYSLADSDADLTDDAHALAVTIAPSVDLRALPHLEANQWLVVDVVGQYAHPAAESCRATPTGGDGEGPPRPEVVVLRCREQFVVTSLTAHADT